MRHDSTKKHNALKFTALASADAGNDIFLSKQRAEALKAQLILNGVNPASIETRGRGQNNDGTSVEGAVPPPEGAAMRSNC